MIKESVNKNIYQKTDLFFKKPSSDLISEKEIFDKTGIIFFGNFLESDILDILSKEVDSLLTHTTDSNKLFNLHFENSIIQKIACLQIFVNIASKLLNDDSVQIISSLILVKPAHSKMIVPWHQDAAYYWPIEPLDSVSLWLALDEVTIANGAMKLAVGAHLDGKLPMIPTPSLAKDEYTFSTQLKDSISPQIIENYPLVDCEMKKGEFSFHHSLLPHSSKPNETDSRRAAFIVRYCKKDAKIVRYAGMPREEYFKDYQLFKV